MSHKEVFILYTYTVAVLGHEDDPGIDQCRKLFYLCYRINLMDRTRNIAFILLLSASLVMIFNSMRPHHHHHYMVCFTSSHCEEEGPCDSGTDKDQHGWDHQHGHPINELCKLNAYYIIPDSKSNVGKVIPRAAIKTLLFQGILMVDQQERMNFQGQASAGFIHEQSLKPVKCLSRALRAPPSC